MNQTEIAPAMTKIGQDAPDGNHLLQLQRRRMESEFAELRTNHPKLLRLTLNEAEAIAAGTGVAHLVFPLLAREKVAATIGWLHRQRRVRSSAFHPISAVRPARARVRLSPVRSNSQPINTERSDARREVVATGIS